MALHCIGLRGTDGPRICSTSVTSDVDSGCVGGVGWARLGKKALCGTIPRRISGECALRIWSHATSAADHGIAVFPGRPNFVLVLRDAMRLPRADSPRICSARFIN